MDPSIDPIYPDTNARVNALHFSKIGPLKDFVFYCNQQKKTQRAIFSKKQSLYID